MIDSRRDFLKAGGVAVGASLLSGTLLAQKKYLDLPLGLQLYSVRTLLPKDYEGTLKQVASVGYREVEAAGFYNKSASEVKADMKAAGLRCVSSHYGYNALKPVLDDVIAYGKELGLEYIICSSPGHKDPTKKPVDKTHSFSIEDWRWNAEEFNAIGKKIHAAGMKFGYHNHYLEFQKVDGEVPFLELVKNTDPAYVTFEMDCGWVVVGGGDPVEMLKMHGPRITMLHVKDFKQAGAMVPGGKPPEAAELGMGTIDYTPIFAQAAKNGNMRHCFVEQEEFLDMPAMQALKIDADYVKKLRG
jgi:sugar phosphate isomerase/epimerase